VRRNGVHKVLYLVGVWAMKPELRAVKGLNVKLFGHDPKVDVVENVRLDKHRTVVELLQSLARKNICSCSDIGWVLVVRILVHGYRPLSKPMSLWPGGRVHKSSIEKGVLGQIEFNHLLQLTALTLIKGLVLVKDVIKVDGWVLKVSWVVDGISEESEEGFLVDT